MRADSRTHLQRTSRVVEGSRRVYTSVPSHSDLSTHDVQQRSSSRLAEAAEAAA